MNKRRKTLHLEVSKDQSNSPQEHPPPHTFLMRVSKRRRERKARTVKEKKRVWHLVPALERKR